MCFFLLILYSNVGNAHRLKMDKYAALVGDLENAGYRVNLFCFEVSVRGQITKANKARLKSFLFHVIRFSFSLTF